VAVVAKEETVGDTDANNEGDAGDHT